MPSTVRRRLLSAALKLFARHGYHAVAVDDVVRAARVNKRMVYHYFGSKEALFAAALTEVYGRIEGIEFAAVKSGASAQEKLTHLLEAYFAFLDDEPEFTRMLLWENLEMGRHLRKGGAALTKNRFMVRFGEVIEEGIRAGEFRADIDVTHLLVHFIGLCFIYHSNQFSLSQSLSIDLGSVRVKRRGLREAIALVFEGIAQRPRKARQQL